MQLEINLQNTLLTRDQIISRFVISRIWEESRISWMPFGNHMNIFRNQPQKKSTTRDFTGRSSTWGCKYSKIHTSSNRTSEPSCSNWLKELGKKKILEIMTPNKGWEREQTRKDFLLLSQVCLLAISTILSLLNSQINLDSHVSSELIVIEMKIPNWCVSSFE